MRIGVLASYCLTILILVLSFCKIPLFNIVIPVMVILLFFLNQYNGSVLLKQVLQVSANNKSKFLGYDVYIVDKKTMGNHNIAVIGYKSPIIFVEQEVKNNLSSECLNALLLHEAGHIYQKNRKNILVLKYVGMALLCVGLNNSIYGDSLFLNIICIVGIIVFVSTQIKEKSNEYRADQYALEHGASKEELIQGLLAIDRMNGKRGVNRNMTHPALEKRTKRIRKFS